MTEQINLYNVSIPRFGKNLNTLFIFVHTTYKSQKLTSWLLIMEKKIKTSYNQKLRNQEQE